MTWLRLLLAAVILTAAAASAAEVAPAQPGAGDKCPVCGMFVAKYPDFLAQIVFKDGSRDFFDGVKDMMKYYFELGKYRKDKQLTDIAAIWVTDYYSLSPIDGQKAYYVVGSDVYGPMGKELIPFKEEAEAKDFLKDHAGQQIYRFNDITKEVIKPLD
jgi:nitrous oxide reductase accessory protein NosL